MSGNKPGPNNKTRMTANLKELSKSQLLQMLEASNERQEKLDRLNGINIELVEGMTKQGKPFKVLAVKGGELGWRGLNLKPASWARLVALREEIDEAMKLHFPEGK